MRKTSQDEQILRASKEIVVKFIETGRISPTGFPEVFKTIYQAVDETVKLSAATEIADENAEKAS
jgi:predicted transcriptional regulator